MKKTFLYFEFVLKNEECYLKKLLLFRKILLRGTLLLIFDAAKSMKSHIIHLYIRLNIKHNLTILIICGGQKHVFEVFDLIILKTIYTSDYNMYLDSACIPERSYMLFFLTATQKTSITILVSK